MSVFREGASNAAAGAHVVVLVATEVLLAGLVRAPFLVCKVVLTPVTKSQQATSTGAGPSAAAAAAVVP